VRAFAARHPCYSRAALPRLSIIRIRPGHIAAAALAAALFWSAGAAADESVPGTRIQMRVEDLPAPNATPSTANPPQAVAPPEGAALTAPPGFDVSVFADGLEDARWMAVAENGDVFLAQPSSGQVTLLRDTNGDGKADAKSVFAGGLSQPHGLAIRGGYLYIGDTEGVWRVPYRAGQEKAEAKPQLITPEGAFGGGNGHWTRNLAFSPDGTRFYVAIGSGTNIGIEKPPRATVQEFSADGKPLGTYASGLRNPVGISFYPGSEDLFVVVNERDTLGDGLVPDYLTHLVRGGFYGWPYSYIGAHPQPGFADKAPELVKQAIVPDLLFKSHSAPLGLVFYEGAQFPAEYKGSAFVALHGSWNAKEPRGYMVVRVPFEAGRPKGYYESFLTGFRLQGQKGFGSQAQVWGRPAGLAVAHDGTLLVADDVGNKIWRVSYGK
jgi:glucose/arabinose dehydrogenase